MATAATAAESTPPPDDQPEEASTIAASMAAVTETISELAVGPVGLEEAFEEESERLRGASDEEGPDGDGYEQVG